MDLSNYKNYDTTLDTLKSHLEEYGVATIPNVLSTDELESNRKELWKLLHNLTKNLSNPIIEDDTSTWSTYSELYPTKSMMLQYYGIGHNQLSWNIRQNPNVVNVFSKLWDTQPYDMLTSFDGMSWQPQPEITNKGFSSKIKKWLHVDQAYTKLGFKCYQGQVILYDVDQGDATLNVLEKSHKFHSEVGKHFNKLARNDYYQLKQSEIDYYKEKGCQEHKVLAKAGSLILWDSRTVHEGTVPIKGRPNPKNRCSLYVCMMPRSQISDKDLEKKKMAFENQRTTSHWTNKCILFGKNPQTYGKPLPNIDILDKPVLTDLGKRLAGF
jgi:hypothetical protein